MATTFKVTVKNKRKDGLYAVYVRVTHNRQIAYLPTDKLPTDKYLSATKDVTDPKIGEISDMTKCFENFVSQTLGFLASFFCCGIKE